jgi:hypothetical protein
VSVQETADPHPQTRTPRGVKGKGVRYERDVQKYLNKKFGPRYAAGPWFKVTDIAHGSFNCQPDGVLLDANRQWATVFEVKLKHTPRAWWQLRGLYQPVVAARYGLTPQQVSVVEICMYCDPSMAFPEAVEILSSVDDVRRDNSFYVVPWNPRFEL